MVIVVVSGAPSTIMVKAETNDDYLCLNRVSLVFLNGPRTSSC
jgi:hypothetical protein